MKNSTKSIRKILNRWVYTWSLFTSFYCSSSTYEVLFLYWSGNIYISRPTTSSSQGYTADTCIFASLPYLEVPFFEKWGLAHYLANFLDKSSVDDDGYCFITEKYRNDPSHGSLFETLYLWLVTLKLLIIEK